MPKLKLSDILKTCDACHRTMDVDLFDAGASTCQLCLNREASKAALKARMKGKQEAARERTRNMTPEDRYRLQLERSSPYTDDEIERLVARRFPKE